MVFVRDYVGTESQTVVRILCQIQEEVAVGFLCRIQVSVLYTQTIFGEHLTGQVHELFLISDVFQCHYVMGI